MEDYTITIDLNGRKGQIILPSDATKSELGMMKEFLCKAVDTRIEHAKVLEVMANPLKADIVNLELSVRTCTCLKRAGLDTVADVLSLTKTELQKVRNLGRNSYEEAIEVFSKFGSFKEESVVTE